MNNESFEPSSLNIKSIFKNDDVRYRIPNYQRRYKWQDEQLDALWGDLYEAYQNRVNCYFLGSIVVVKNNNYLDVIDGQQRLTTLTIMISVLNTTYPDIDCKNPNDNEDEANTIDKETFANCLFVKPTKGTERLVVQPAAEYVSNFSMDIIQCSDFSKTKKPTKSELKSDNPKFCYLNTAKFFYDKFKELDEEDRKNFIFYIFNNVKLIRIACNDVSFAIKIFQVMNDRGMPLSSSDIIKSYIMSEIDKTDDKDNLNAVFNANWKYIEDKVTENNFKMDDFMVCYEYFKLKSNPKRQVIDELKEIITKENNINTIINELKIFAEKLDEVYSSQNKVILSLRYIPWKFYVTTALVSAYYVNYENKDELFKLIRRYFYLAFISGKTLNQIKQTSFNLIEKIVNVKTISEVESILNDSISKYKMVKTVYENLKDDVFGENYLKPLLLSIEYEQREILNTNFVEINSDLHMDHILPQAFFTEKDWNYIDANDANKYINTLGNMALLYCKKNEEALNKGFAKKVNIYLGKNPDGSSNNNGATCFDTTKEITTDYIKSKSLWNVDDIKRRFDTQMERIEKIFDISEDKIEKMTYATADDLSEKVRLPRFNFFELGINKGEKLYWYNDKNIICEVVDEHNVLYNGNKTSLSAIAKEKLSLRNVNGALYFKYNDKSISEIYKIKIETKN